MGVARAWSRSEMGKFLPSLSVNFIIYLQNVWSAMSLSLLVPEEKKLQISINFQKSVYPLYICIYIYIYIYIYVCQYNFIQKFANFKTLLWKDHKR